MSTRALIGLAKGDKYWTVYVHHDGYPEYLGKILKEYYNTKAKARKLISLGDLSFVGKEIGRKHTFDSYNYEKHHDWTIAYGRDLEEENTQPKLLTKKGIAKRAENELAEYVYLFDNGKWHSYKVEDGVLQPIENKERVMA